MLKQFLNSGSLKSLMLFDTNNDEGSDDPKAKLREQIAKGNLPNTTPPASEEVIEEGEEEIEEEVEEVETEEEQVEETDEQKAEREAKEKLEAKAKRKSDRMQARIDEATAKRKEAEAEVARLRAQLEANPEQKLTEEEVQSRAEAIAAKKLADKNLEEIQANFDKACAKLQKEAKTIDKEFDDKINDIAEQFGPIPSFMIGVLEDFDNGGEVLAFIANDEDVAEKIYSFKNKPAKMTKELVEISNKLIEAKKKPRKQISKVPDSVEPVRGSRIQSNTITEADTKNMENYVAKRQRQILEKRKAQGF